MLDRKLLKQRLAFIRRGGEVTRYHTERTIVPNLVGEHSFNVAWLVNLMTPSLDYQRRYFLVMAALAHDIAENITGDMPAPVKRHLDIREKMGAYEESLMSELALSYGTGLNKEDARVLKLADAMDGAFYCIGEAALGNRRMVAVFNNFRSYIAQLEPTAPVELAIVEYIDELWAEYGEKA